MEGVIALCFMFGVFQGSPWDIAILTPYVSVSREGLQFSKEAGSKEVLGWAPEEGSAVP